MVVENDPSARMQIRTRGELRHPGTCLECGSGTCDEGYLDLGVFFDYEGQMYLCKVCVFQAGETFGMYTPAEVESQQELNAKLMLENAHLTEELNNAAPIIDAWQRAIDAARAVSLSDDSSEQESEGSDSDAKGTPSGTENGEPVTEESVKGSERSGSGGAKRGHVTF